MNGFARGCLPSPPTPLPPVGEGSENTRRGGDGRLRTGCLPSPAVAGEGPGERALRFESRCRVLRCRPSPPTPLPQVGEGAKTLGKVAMVGFAQVSPLSRCGGRGAGGEGAAVRIAMSRVEMQALSPNPSPTSGRGERKHWARSRWSASRRLSPLSRRGGRGAGGEGAAVRIAMSRVEMLALSPNPYPTRGRGEPNTNRDDA